MGIDFIPWKKVFQKKINTSNNFNFVFYKYRMSCIKFRLILFVIFTLKSTVFFLIFVEISIIIFQNISTNKTLNYTIYIFSIFPIDHEPYHALYIHKLSFKINHFRINRTIHEFFFPYTIKIPFKRKNTSQQKGNCRGLNNSWNLNK